MRFSSSPISRAIATAIAARDPVGRRIGSRFSTVRVAPMVRERPSPQPSSPRLAIATRALDVPVHGWRPRERSLITYSCSPSAALRRALIRQARHHHYSVNPDASAGYAAPQPSMSAGGVAQDHCRAAGLDADESPRELASRRQSIAAFLKRARAGSVVLAVLVTWFYGRVQDFSFPHVPNCRLWCALGRVRPDPSRACLRSGPSPGSGLGACTCANARVTMRTAHHAGACPMSPQMRQLGCATSMVRGTPGASDAMPVSWTSAAPQPWSSRPKAAAVARRSAFTSGSPRRSRRRRRCGWSAWRRDDRR